MAFDILAAEGLETDTSIASLGQRYGTTFSGLSLATATPRRPGGTYVGGANNNNTGNNNNRFGTIGTLTDILSQYRTLSFCVANYGTPIWGVSATQCFTGIAVEGMIGERGIGFYWNGTTFSLIHGAAAYNVRPLLEPLIANEWAQLEVVFQSDGLDQFTGTVSLYFNDTLLLSLASDLTSISTNVLYLTPQRGSNGSAGNSGRRALVTADDFVVAASPDTDVRMGETYVDALATDTDVDVTNWSSSIGSLTLAADVNKTLSTVATPFIQTQIAGATATFASSESYPDDGRLIRAVTVVGAGQANSDTIEIQALLNGENVGPSKVLSLGSQTVLNTTADGGLYWQNTIPGTSDRWTVADVNSATFGVRREN